MESTLNAAIQWYKKLIFVSKYITANDPVQPWHQAGFHYTTGRGFVLRCASWGTTDRHITLNGTWFWRDSRFIYYGRTRNEYRLTRFGKGFPYLRWKYRRSAGDMQEVPIITAFVFQSDDRYRQIFFAALTFPRRYNGLILQFDRRQRKTISSVSSAPWKHSKKNFRPQSNAASAVNCYNVHII